MTLPTAKAGGHQQYRAVVDFVAPGFRPRSIMGKIPAEGHQQCRAVVDFVAPEFRPRSIMEKIPAEGDGLSITMQEELNTITLPFYT